MSRPDTSRLCCDGRCDHGRECPLHRVADVPDHPTIRQRIASGLYWFAAAALVSLLAAACIACDPLFQP